MTASPYLLQLYPADAADPERGGPSEEDTGRVDRCHLTEQLADEGKAAVDGKGVEGAGADCVDHRVGAAAAVQLADLLAVGGDQNLARTVLAQGGRLGLAAGGRDHPRPGGDPHGRRADAP